MNNSLSILLKRRISCSQVRDQDLVFQGCFLTNDTILIARNLVIWGRGCLIMTVSNMGGMFGNDSELVIGGGDVW